MRDLYAEMISGIRYRKYLNLDVVDRCGCLACRIECRKFGDGLQITCVLTVPHSTDDLIVLWLKQQVATFLIATWYETFVFPNNTWNTAKRYSS